MATRIVPREDAAKGTDICGIESSQCIIRSDLGCYMKVYHLRDIVRQPKVHPLRSECSQGDHYLATPHHFYIIKGDEYRRVKSLRTDKGATIANLHWSCRGGDYYMATDDSNFYIVFADEGKCLHVNDMSTGANLKKYDLHDACKGGYYYFATAGYFYLVKPVDDEWSLQYHRTRDMRDDRDGVTFPISPSIANFIQGTMAEIVSHKEVNAVDICGQESYQYIIRSDLGCYMKAWHLRDIDKQPTVHYLHPNCKQGDHYLATPYHFYVIKGDECRRVKDISEDSDATIITLHSECQGGSFYLATDDNNFYIIFADRGTYVHVTDMSTAANMEVHKLHADCKKGLHYFATAGYFYLVKPVETGAKWSFQYHRTRDMKTNEEGVTFPIYPFVAEFLSISVD